MADDDAWPYFGPRHRAMAQDARKLAAEADTKRVADMLSVYADDIENECGMAVAPQWMREAAKRLAALEAKTER